MNWQAVLAAWFILWSVYHLQQLVSWGSVGGDALIYYRASAAWVHGGNPWDAAVGPFHFYALPPAVILLSPFTVLPEPTVRVVGIGVEALAAVYVIRRLALPWWWLAFPPLVSGVVTGNPSVALLALLLSGSALIRALAPTLKVYAFLPLVGEGRWRSATYAALLTAASVVIDPGLWAQFLTNPMARASQLLGEADWGLSAWRYGLLVTAGVAGVLIILATVDRRAAGWLAAIAIWPATEFHWSTLALPLRSPWMAVALAPNIPGLPVAAILAYAVWRVMDAQRVLPLRRRLPGSKAR